MGVSHADWTELLVNKEIRRRALLATAKVALSFTVLGAGAGCGAVAFDDHDDALPDDAGRTQPPKDDPVDDDPSVLAVAPATALASKLQCALPSEQPGAGLDDDTLSCCEAYLKPLMPGWDSDWSEFLASAENDGSLRGCCSAMISDADAGTSTSEVFDWSALQPCCAATQSHHGPTCTPWGPPLPARLLRRLEHLDQLLALRTGAPLSEVA